MNCLSLIYSTIWKYLGLAAATIWTFILPSVKNSDHSGKELETYKMNTKQDATETEENEENELAENTDVNKSKKLFNCIHFKHHKHSLTYI